MSTLAGTHDVVVPFRRMRQQSVDNLDWMLTRGHLKVLTAERRSMSPLSDIYDQKQVAALEEFADALHRRALHELVIRASRSNPKRRLR